ncbi:Aflatoxin B1 aldehyde reductase member 3 [Mycena venus]|uniref:Aflatoxin B1 aldehyde reductase member 3 n=1 Tax=Mycena venus TaxID=2733690 RepID=A0A8H7CS59_9AGAR|nr:Aflatoxin B1 aldehyde reductase member 3 [Mycena venus]
MTSTPASQKTSLKVVMGAMTFGEPGIEGARVDKVQDIEAILDTLVQHGHSEIDTARTYCSGTSETMLGKTSWKEKGILIASKLYPFHSFMPELTAAHTPEGLRKALMSSLKSLNTDKLEIWYLHGPDRSVPYEVTLKAIDELYHEGHFKRFGISNYMAWEVAEMIGICKQHGYVQPVVYEGIYNPIHRLVEPELFPALRKFGIAFYGFNPLAGGFFTDRYKSIDTKPEAGSAFDPERFRGKNYRSRYWKAEYFDALAPVALRWVSHHSLMRAASGDAVLIGGSSLKHIEENLIDLEKGPLPDDVVEALDAAWAPVKATSSSYHH